MHDHLLITCEHGGNQVPAAYRPLFKAHQDLLATHRGMDFGALQMARELAAALHAPLYASTTTRLLIDLNRSIGHPQLYSEATRHLPCALHEQIIREHYLPHRARIEAAVAKAIDQGQRVIHIASHSFTPELHGVVRNADIGLLYDPAHPGEGEFARLWQDTLKSLRPDLRVRRNYPYEGRNDGLMAVLRRRHPRHYVGIELEINQQQVFAGGPSWRALRALVIRSLRTALASNVRI